MRRFKVFFLTIFSSLTILAQEGVDHIPYDQLLQKYVNDKGLVNYKGLSLDRPKLREYLTSLEQNAPNDSWSEDQKLAYWINAYNAFTLELILEHYPVSSIKDIGATVKIPFVNTPWDIKFINIGDETYDLNNIEHGIIRKRFDEPRIHFALVCAAISCPKLQNKAYLAETLDEQLTKATKNFLTDPEKNVIESPKKAYLSKIFSWYGGDFTKKGSLIEFLNQYSDTKLERRARIDYKDYDWALNEQR